MEPRTYKRHGRELGNAAAAGAVAGVSWETFTWYARRDRKRRTEALKAGLDVDERYLCPWRVDRDDETGQSLFPMREVRTWNRHRGGRGAWSGIGTDLRTREARAARETTEPALEQSAPTTTDELPAVVGA